jgi:uracil-DNA glycosylase
MIATIAAKSLIDSHASWWALAGYDTVIGEEPVDWLAPPAPAPTLAPPPQDNVQRNRPAPDPVAPPPPAAPPPLAPLAIPDEWAAFHNWLAEHPAVPGTRWNQRRILPQGNAGAPLMVFSLCPEIADEEHGALHSGPAGQLLDAMLRAIGMARGDCYLASLALTRPPGGRIDETELTALAPLLWHHLRLARPQRLLIFGTDLARMIAATDVSAARGTKLFINQDGSKVEAVATQHPLLLLDRPARKAAAWDSLKLLAQG